MAMTALEKLRARIQEQQNTQEAVKNGTFPDSEREPDAFLAHWNIEFGKTLKLRFLPDGNPNNPDIFFVERQMIELPFNGIKGEKSEVVKVQVPCVEMWEPMSCPILNQLRPLWKTEMEEVARKYWVKRSYLMQCLIAPDSTEVLKDNPPENPIRRVLLSKPLMRGIKLVLANPDGLDALPTDYVHGLDYHFTKSKNSMGYNDYSGCDFARRERALNDEELAAIEKYGLFDLDKFLPKRPNEEELNAIVEMFEASLNGEAYDPARWAKYYRPAGVKKPNIDSNTVAKIIEQKQVEQEEAENSQTEPQTTEKTKNTTDLLNMIKKEANAVNEQAKQTETAKSAEDGKKSEASALELLKLAQANAKK